MPNHFHLLVRTGRHPLARSLRSLLTGYAGAFNRRSQRSGHVLQNRYTSVVCDEAVYCLALVRSLHLNPLRARIVADMEGVAKYASSGQVALGGTRAYGWQDTAAVLPQCGRTRVRAQREYLRFVAAGVNQGRRVELQGGGLIGVPVFSKVGRVPRAEHHYRCAAHQKPRVSNPLTANTHRKVFSPPKSKPKEPPSTANREH